MEFKLGSFDAQMQHNQVYRAPNATSETYSDHAMQAVLLLSGRCVDNRETIHGELENEMTREVRRELIMEGEIISSPSESGKKDVIRLGVKREPPSPTTANSSGPWKKKPIEEWCCGVCQINTTCYHDLNVHLAGKKHQTKMATLVVDNTDARLGLGVAPMKPTTKLVKILKCVKEVVKTQPLAIHSSSKSIQNGSNKFTFWCETCQVGSSSEIDMNMHKNGKKHSKEFLKLGGPI